VAKTKPCMEPGCERPKRAGVHRCVWHWLLKQPIEVQVRAADHRLKSTPDAEFKPRVNEAKWPPGERWCAGCQFFVPLFYTRQSRCVACASRGAHRSHVEGTYEITYDEYERLGEWQGWRCYICQRVARSGRLAVDHDHHTGEVRGLLCADDKRGCNHAILGNIRDLDMARRIVAYLERPPLERMRAGEPKPDGISREKAARQAVLGTWEPTDMPVEAPTPQNGVQSLDWTIDPNWDF
jgi:hypothetical protein